MTSAQAPLHAQRVQPTIDVFEATIPELQRAMESGAATSVQLVDAYLARIDAYDQSGPRLNAILRINPTAREEAAALDRERAERGPRGPLHGVPILLKDNYDAAGMATTGASIALAAHQPLKDAFQVSRLRQAGAIILAKTNLHELAYGISTISSLGGQTLNPYDVRRNPGGSSGGTGAAVAASFAAVGWGSDTCGSIRIPAAVHNLVGLRPTKGLSSIDGILPLSHSQDTGGPLARSITDLAIALDATVGPDPADPATAILEGRALPRFADSLDPAALQGARIGVLRQYFGEASEERETGEVLMAALEEMRALGAEVVDVQIPDFEELLSGTSLIDFEFKWDLLDYLARTPGTPVTSLGEIVESGQHHRALEAILRRSDRHETREPAGSAEARTKREQLHVAIAAAMDDLGLDALAYPTLRREAALIGEPALGSNCQLSAATGMPALTIPAGFTARRVPVGLELLGRRFADDRLISFGYAYEQAVQPRRPPPFTPTLVDGASPPLIAFTSTAAAAGGTPEGGGARAAFRYDPVLGTLDYEIEVEGLAPDHVHAVVLRNGQGGPVLHRLVGPRPSSSSGRVMLDVADRSALEAGELVLQVFAGEEGGPAAQGTVRLPER